MCNLLSGREQVSPCSFAHLSERPTLLLMHQSRSAEQVLVGVLVELEAQSSPSHHFRWGCRDPGIGITFSSDFGTLQLLFKCHCMGLMWSRPKWTCFSVAVIINPITGTSAARPDMLVRREVSGFCVQDLPPL